MDWHQQVTTWAIDRYPRSSAYDIDWMMDNMMGPNALWLMEALADPLHLQAEMRLLDMGCGKAISSIFLAKEYGVQVWATDLWIGAAENWERIRQAGVERSVFPIHAEAHRLPFADGFFVAAVSVEAYHYFGTDDLYLDYFANFVRPGGQIGIVVPGLVQEFDAEPPDHLRPVWPSEFYSFHSPAWWQRHWERSGRVQVTTADFIAEGWKDWLLWVGDGHEDGKALRVDQGRNLGFTRIVATNGSGPDVGS
jgi:cyclopropane fatty-acyl-phospholipid synthase-like methyltransferase